MTLPEGLTYVPGVLTEAGERDALALLATVELHPYVLHDTPSRRLMRSFGRAQVAGAYDAGPAAPIPAELEWLRERCSRLMGREPGELVDPLVTRYPPGAGIGWRRDAPHSPSSPAPPNVLSGPARTQWQHHIPPLAQERWSITFRTPAAHHGRHEG
jgi:alkylated DNA repair protein (DNA oxidative demethylase)